MIVEDVFTVTDLKDKMIELNKKISWTPKEIGEGRFGKWLEGARDWAISRSRYWGAPLPVWENNKKELIVLGSINELQKYTKKSGNKYFVMRHGEAENNTRKILSTKKDNPHHLTPKGISQTKEAAEKLKKEKINLIISSPFIRTKETAEMVADIIGLERKDIIYDEKIGEHNYGDWDLMPVGEYYKYYRSFEEAFIKAPPNGENYDDMKRRAGEFLYDVEKKYSGKNILIITHESPSWLITAVSLGLDRKGCMKLSPMDENFLENGEFRKFDFVPLPHNDKYELDLHRPYIDELLLEDRDGSKLKRIPEVFDCWLESGSMPFAQVHYPFENKKEFEKNDGSLFPAEFIAEGLDQTRGWFYTLLVLSAGLFKKSPYNSVIVNGLILAEDGHKMSKSLNNYPDIMYIIDKYGADSLRYYIISSQAVRAEDLNFSEKGIDEVSKKIILKLDNVLSFYEIYTNKGRLENREKLETKHILDKWILSRLNELHKNVTVSLDAHRIDNAARPIMDFVEDFSTWYIRRSRDRFKSDDMSLKKEALETTSFVLLKLSKCMAPFMPFFAEHIYLKLKLKEDPESVHLCDWPKEEKIDKEILKNMEETRKVVSLALEKRMAAGIKVRQPLQKLTIFNFQFSKKEEYINLIKDEINVKEIIFSDDKKEENKVELDTKITEELQKEGNIRDFVRAVQELRKNKNLKPSDMVELLVETDEAGKKFIEETETEIKKPTNVSGFIFENNDGSELKIENYKLKIKIK